MWQPSVALCLCSCWHWINMESPPDSDQSHFSTESRKMTPVSLWHASRASSSSSLHLPCPTMGSHPPHLLPRLPPPPSLPTPPFAVPLPLPGAPPVQGPAQVPLYGRPPPAGAVPHEGALPGAGSGRHVPAGASNATAHDSRRGNRTELPRQPAVRADASAIQARTCHHCFTRRLAWACCSGGCSD